MTIWDWFPQRTRSVAFERRRRASAHALLDNWWVDQPDRPDEAVLERLQLELDRLLLEDPTIDPDRAFFRVIAPYEAADD